MTDIGKAMYALIAELFPVCRSITGSGLRATLRRIQQEIPLTLHEVPSRTPVLDWSVPNEWHINDAWIANAAGERVVDFRRSNLHVVNYSTPVRQRMQLKDLKPHLFAIPDHPDWIPYRTSYYQESWGFCLSQRQLDALPDGTYDVCIDSTLAPGALTYGELCVAGTSSDEILISTHCCHPSLANDNLSGIALAVALARRVAGTTPAKSYRFLFIPGTIGSITWLARNEQAVSRIKHGLVLTGVGDRGPLTYKQSRRGDALVDRAATHVLKHRQGTPRVVAFSPYGYDERQYCSPGFDLAVGRLTRTPHGEYPEYHTSADNLDFVTPESLADAYAASLDILDILENDQSYENLSPKGEPQLGRRGLYQGIGGRGALPGSEMALLWVLSYSDGRHSLLDIADRAGLPFTPIKQAADALVAHQLLRAVE